MVRKIGPCKGPQQTSTAADFMKPWLDDVSDDDTNEEGDTTTNETAKDIWGQMSTRMAECSVMSSYLY